MQKSSKILLIDDEPDILEVVGMFLKRDGFEVMTADCGKSGLEMIAQHNFDLVVCDYLMPGMDGISMLKRVRSEKNYTPFIFFSGNADDDHALEMVGLGAYKMLPKTEIMNLTDLINKTLSHSDGVKILDQNSTKEDEEFLEVLHSVKVS